MTTTALEGSEQIGAGRLAVRCWSDPVIDRLGHDPRSPYVERFWLPVLGPSTTFFLRHLAIGLERSPSGYDLSVQDAARALGLGDRSGRNAPFARTLARAIDFEMARLHGDLLEVRRRMPPLARRHLLRLPESLQAEHERLGRLAPPSEIERLHLRGRQLALSLLQLGEPTEAVRQQLARWRFEPTLAEDCLAWAIAQQATAP
ncbi:MAG: hypothetical protein JWM85_1454 [Acidimicrobiaceae bacterium]|nr:hypothetical protein [Acidimicrobiaceae bacterium]